MFERMSKGWELAGQSFEVLRAEKQLLIFPLLSSFACMLVLASFALPLWNTPQAQLILHDRTAPQDPMSYVILFLFYLANYFVIAFFNAALVSCATMHFQGGRPTIGDGFRMAVARLPQVAGWALVSATVGFVLRIVESRSERGGAFVAGLAGMAWSVVTYLAVPVLVVERAGPWEVIKRSTALVRKTWGEALTAQVGVGMIFFVVFLVGLLPLVAAFLLGVYLMAHGLPITGGVAIALGVAVLVLISLVSSALHTIIVAAVYIYAAEGIVPDAFGQETLAGLFTNG
jgi:hypothetical protein